MTQDLLHATGLQVALPDLAHKPPFRRAPVIYILHGVDFRIRRDEAVGIVGSSAPARRRSGGPWCG